jgi:hypothetical protein
LNLAADDTEIIRRAGGQIKSRREQTKAEHQPAHEATLSALQLHLAKDFARLENL